MDDRFDAITAEARDLITQEVNWRYNDKLNVLLVPQCESPIEKLFAAAWVPMWVLDPLGFSIKPQMEIGKYRVDFAITHPYSPTNEVRVAVECDGHAFHEKTKEQAARDKRRDRELVLQGWPVMRFTGSEIWKDPFSCVDQVVDYLQGEAHDRSMSTYRALLEERRRTGKESA